MEEKSKGKSAKHAVVKSHKEKEDKEKQEKELAKKLQNNDMPKAENGETHIESNTATYEIREELGQGSFGSVFRVKRESDGKCFAMKCESVHVRKQILAHEARVLLSLNLLNSVHFVEMIDNGKIGGRFLFLILKLVGQNLWDIRIKLPERKYTLNTSLKIAEQTMEGIRDLHRVGFLHRDIKPPNFAVGREEDDSFHTVYVLDFGLCRRICVKGVDLRTPRTTCAFRGTTRYAALAAHDMKEQSRKDDLESWWYMIAEMIVYELPWKQLKGTDRDGVRLAKRRLREDKNAMKILFRMGCYTQMSSILYYIDDLTYQSIPDYDYINNQISSLCESLGLGPKDPVDWDKKRDYFGPKYTSAESYIIKELQ